MPFLPQDRWATLQAMGIQDPGEAAIVAMLEIQTTLLKEIRDAVGGGSGGSGIEAELAKIKNELDEGNQIAISTEQHLVGMENALQQLVTEGAQGNLIAAQVGNELAQDLTNINDTLEDIENKIPGPPGPPNP
jgi:hypothetical protein